MKIQCLVPKYNNGEYFEASVLSLVNQETPYSSIIISENYSNDGSEDLVKNLALKYSIISYFTPNKPAKSFGHNVSELINRMDITADYIHIASSDDIWSKKYISSMIKYLQRNNDVTGIFCDRIFINERDKILGASGNLSTKPTLLNQGYEGFEYFSRGCSYIISGALFRTDVLINFSDIIQKTEFSADWIIMLEAARLGNIVYLDNPLFKYRLHSSNSTKLGFSHKKNIEIYCNYLNSIDKNASAILKEKQYTNSSKSITFYNTINRKAIKRKILYYLHMFKIIFFLRKLKYINEW